MSLGLDVFLFALEGMYCKEERGAHGKDTGGIFPATSRYLNISRTPITLIPADYLTLIPSNDLAVYYVRSNTTSIRTMIRNT